MRRFFEVEPRVSIVIVSFNTRELTLECLRSIGRETKATPYEILVVDNDSSDGTAAAVAAEFPDVRLIALDENIGFARANNLAAESASGQRLLLLNPDTVILDQAIDRLVDFADAHPDAGIWGGRTVFADGSLNPTSCWRQMTVWGLICSALGLRALFRHSALFNSESYGGWQRDSVRAVDIVTGCLLLIDAALWRELGGFDPRFFMYGEEADLCLRAQRRGARPLVTPDATIVHYGSASDPVEGDKEVSVARAKITLIRQHWSPARRRLGEALLLLSSISHSLGYSIAARLLRRPSLGRRARVHSEVWARRDEWLRGYVPARLGQPVVRSVKKTVKAATALVYLGLDAVVRLALRLVGRKAAGRLVVLYYHDVPAAARRGFARQMDALARSVRVVPAAHEGPLEPGQRCVAITFDDALQSVADHAVPELAARSLPATIFVPAGWLAREPEWDQKGRSNGREAVMDEDQLRSLPSEVVTIGSHSLRHPHLTELDDHSLSEELAGSRDRLEALLGRPVHLFAFPYGEHDDRVVEHCREAGYERVFNIVPRPVDPSNGDFVRGRVSVGPNDGPLEFFLKARGAYSWMRYVSALKRALRG